MTIVHRGKSLSIGSSRGGYGFFDGLIDEVEIFNSVLTASEIAAIYNAGSTGKCRSCAPPPSGLVAWWQAEGDVRDFFGN